MTAAMVMAAAMLGVLVGQVTVGIPLYCALRRCECRHAPQDFEADQAALAAWLAAYRRAWPTDHAALQLDVWQRLRLGELADGWCVRHRLGPPLQEGKEGNGGN